MFHSSLPTNIAYYLIIAVEAKKIYIYLKCIHIFVC